MTSRIAQYQDTLSLLPEKNWEPFLVSESGLPGPRGNLELAQAVAALGGAELFWRLSRYSPVEAPVNDPNEFLVFCGVLGFGRLISEGDRDFLTELRAFASDPRWRAREAVAMALQTIGKSNMLDLLEIAGCWSTGNYREKRAVIAGLAEPVLLKNLDSSQKIFDIFDFVTGSLQEPADRGSEGYRVLRQGLAYAWSVVVSAWPEEGKNRLEFWLKNQDKDIRWVMKQNLLKKRLVRVAPEWTAGWLLHIS